MLYIMSNFDEVYIHFPFHSNMVYFYMYRAKYPISSALDGLTNRLYRIMGGVCYTH